MLTNNHQQVLVIHGITLEQIREERGLAFGGAVVDEIDEETVGLRTGGTCATG